MSMKPEVPERIRAEMRPLIEAREWGNAAGPCYATAEVRGWLVGDDRCALSKGPRVR